jgi:formyltetrahydrofolate synthetase
MYVCTQVYEKGGEGIELLKQGVCNVVKHIQARNLLALLAVVYLLY